jgi:hypothetical protein
MTRGDDEDVTGFKSSLKSFQCVCVKLIYVWMLLIYISWESTLIIRNFEEQSHSVEFYKVDHARWLCFFVKLVTQSMKSSSVLFFHIYVLSIWGVMSWVLVYAIYLNSRVYAQPRTWGCINKIFSLFFIDCLLWFFLWVMFTRAFICLVLLIDGSYPCKLHYTKCVRIGGQLLA